MNTHLQAFVSVFFRRLGRLAGEMRGEAFPTDPERAKQHIAIFRSRIHQIARDEALFHGVYSNETWEAVALYACHIINIDGQTLEDIEQYGYRVAAPIGHVSR